VDSIDLSPEEFERLSQEILAIATRYLRELDGRSITPQESGIALEELYHSPLPELGLGAETVHRLAEVVRHSRAQNGRFFGYVLGSGDPAAAATEVLCSVLNQNVTAWRSSPAAATIERTLVSWLAQAIGCAGFQGTLTGGGSSANLMALAMAREALAPANERGLRSGKRIVIYASSEVHMSITKAIALLGIGRENIRRIAVDGSFRMIPAELARAMDEDCAHQIAPVVVATAGTVNTGAIDPLPYIARIATNYGAWFHVDGAYGALAAIAVPEKFPGLQLADSISLDPHKWLYQPLDCGCLLYRDRAAARRAFSDSQDYVRPFSDDPIESYAVFEESMDLSRRFRGLKVWFSMLYHGFAKLRQSIQKDLRHAQRLAEAIQCEPALEIRAPVELSAVCFRYIGDRKLADPQLNVLNAAILKRIIARGRIYLSNATLESRFCLRACIVNHRSKDADIDRVTSEVLAAAQDTL
jgi:glutamate/tyrosine decarboxylase-like PLP-dependent enzyme